MFRSSIIALIAISSSNAQPQKQTVNYSFEFPDTWFYCINENVDVMLWGTTYFTSNSDNGIYLMHGSSYGRAIGKSTGNEYEISQVATRTEKQFQLKDSRSISYSSFYMVRLYGKLIGILHTNSRVVFLPDEEPHVVVDHVFMHCK